MPPSGKMPVSTAALRTISTASPMSTKASRLAEYSIVKCGMFCPPAVPAEASSREVAAHRAVGTVVGLNCVALAGLDRADERSRQHDLTWFEGKPEGCDLVGEPGD